MSPECSPCGKALKLSLPYYKSFCEQKSNDPDSRLNWRMPSFDGGRSRVRSARRKNPSGSSRQPSGISRLCTSPNPTNVEVQIGLARSCQALALEAVRSSQPEVGSQTARLAAELWTQVVRARPDDPEPRRCLGRSHDIAGWARSEAGDNVGAKRRVSRRLSRS